MTSKTHHIVYHLDQDGAASAAIVYHFWMEAGIGEEEIGLHPINYGYEFPKECYGSHVKEVAVLDFMMQPEEKMLEVIDRLVGKLTWIDHHKTAVDFKDKHVSFPYLVKSENEKGPVSACELTYGRFFPSMRDSLFIKTMGDWDTWRYRDFDNEDAYLVKLYTDVYMDPTNPEMVPRYEGCIFASDTEQKEIIHDMVCEGTIIADAKESDSKRLMYSSFECVFQGYKALVVNGSGSSRIFDSKYDTSKHDVLVTFHWTGSKWAVGLYSESQVVGTGKLHCGDLARTLGAQGPFKGGGGHAGAAGFQTGTLGMVKLFPNIFGYDTGGKFDSKKYVRYVKVNADGEVKKRTMHVRCNSCGNIIVFDNIIETSDLPEKCPNCKENL